MYLKSVYKKHYQKYIEDIYKNRFGEVSTISFNDKSIDCLDRTGESKINYMEIEEIFETGDYFFLKMKSGVVLIIPKTKVENFEKVKVELKNLSYKLQINYSQELKWKWE
jgi:hypothetical protein